MSLAQTNDDDGGGGEDSENLYKSPIAVARFDRAEDGRGNETTSRRSDGRRRRVGNAFQAFRAGARPSKPGIA